MHLNTQCALHTILIFLKHFLHIFFWGGGEEGKGWCWMREEEEANAMWHVNQSSHIQFPFTPENQGFLVATNWCLLHSNW